MRRRVTIEETCIIMQIDCDDPSKIVDTILDNARRYGTESVLTDLAHALRHLIEELDLYLYIDFEGIAICYVPVDDSGHKRELLNKVKHIVNTFRKLGYRTVETKIRLSRCM